MTEPEPRASAWSGRLIGLAIAVLLAADVALVTVPLLVEAESNPAQHSALGLLLWTRDAAQDAHQRLSRPPSAVCAPIEHGGCGIARRELGGFYYTVEDRIYTDTHHQPVLVARPRDSSAPWCAYRFSWHDDTGTFEQEKADSLEDFLAKIGVAP